MDADLSSWTVFWNSFGTPIILAVGVIAVFFTYFAASSQTAVSERDRRIAEGRQSTAEERQKLAEQRQRLAEARQDAAEKRQAEAEAKQRQHETRIGELTRAAAQANESAKRAEGETAKAQLRIEALRAENLKLARALAPRLFADQITAANALRPFGPAESVVEYMAGDVEARRTAEQIAMVLHLAGWNPARPKSNPDESAFFDGVRVFVVNPQSMDILNGELDRREAAAAALVGELEKSSISAAHTITIDEAITPGTILVRVGIKPNPAYDIDDLNRADGQKPRINLRGGRIDLEITRAPSKGDKAPPDQSKAPDLREPKERKEE